MNLLLNIFYHDEQIFVKETVYVTRLKCSLNSLSDVPCMFHITFWYDPHSPTIRHNINVIIK